MKLYKPSTDHITFTACPQVATLCRPLQEAFNSNYFAYNRIYWNGAYFSLSSRMDWCRHYWENDYHLYSQGFPDIRKGGYFFADDYSRETGYMNRVHRIAEEKFDICHGVMKVKHNVGSTDIYMIGAPKKYEGFSSYLYRNVDYFERFIYYFKSSAAKLIKQAKHSKLHLAPEHLSQDVFDTNLSIWRDDSIKDKFTQLQCNRYYLDGQHADTYLTRQEALCLSLLSQGLQYVIIAERMGITVRTVDYHIRNLKTKLNCRNRRHLIATAQELYFDKLEIDEMLCPS